MDSIKSLIKKPAYRKPPCKYEWQELAREIISKLNVPKNKESSIYRCCREDQRTAKYALRECLELEKTNWLYFFKVWNNNRKK